MNGRHVCLPCLLRHGRFTSLPRVASRAQTIPDLVFKTREMTPVIRARTLAAARAIHTQRPAPQSKLPREDTKPRNSKARRQNLARNFMSNLGNNNLRNAEKEIDLTHNQLEDIESLKEEVMRIQERAAARRDKRKDRAKKEISEKVLIAVPELSRLILAHGGLRPHFEDSGKNSWQSMLRKLRRITRYNEERKVTKGELEIAKPDQPPEVSEQTPAKVELEIAKSDQSSEISEQTPAEGEMEIAKDQSPEVSEQIPITPPVTQAETTNARDQTDDTLVQSEEDDGADDPDVGPPEPSTSMTLQTKDGVLEPLDVGEVTVPKLSFDLSRVLFNPGVYQLRDPRSRVFNFDPYLQRPMPVSEFNFDALNEYVTSSEDDFLRSLAKEHDKRYIGSSSSMSSALSQFHFLLSSWRPMNLDRLSKGFAAESTNFTRITRAPSSIFLRWKDGVYAVDADKEFDTANILMSLGKSLEKLLTLSKDDFERYRKSSTQEQLDWSTEPEQYHYGGLGKFLLRSQLDAHDSRLPGTGVFDLKTRAVVAVRMALEQHERGQGYQLKELQGTWESYEREYYDMVRSTFLKYSLQVRMGRMDGVFVAYHNVETLFGFQYIPLPDMDLALHGQTDSTLGDREFGYSVQLMSELFDRVTTAFPEQSIRFHFDTRESTAKIKQKVHRMYVFAEPMSEEQIQSIQKSNQADIKAYEEKLRNPKPELQTQPNAENEDGEDIEGEGGERGGEATSPGRQDSSADVDFLDSLSELNLDELEEEMKTPSVGAAAPAPAAGSGPVPSLLGFNLVVRSTVNGAQVLRPEKISARDKWVLHYELEPMSDVAAQSKYALCKARRRAAMRMEESDKTLNGYFQKLFRMSDQGARWRQEQDKLDANRETVVLYGDNNGR